MKNDDMLFEVMNNWGTSDPDRVAGYLDTNEGCFVVSLSVGTYDNPSVIKLSPERAREVAAHLNQIADRALKLEADGVNATTFWRYEK